jgi:oligopeptide transport system permease protein
LIKDGAEVMDIDPLALLLPGGIMVILLMALTLVGEKLRDRFV